MKSIAIICAFALGFIIAQGIKTITFLATNRKLPLKDVVIYSFKSGGMPSGHSASFAAATTVIGFAEGFGSPLFALALCVFAIVVYDAVNVRYSVGEQGKALTAIIKKHDPAAKTVKIVEGHTIPQVIIGTIIGILIGVIIAKIALFC